MFLPHLLALPAWLTLLVGLSTMQDECGSPPAGVNQIGVMGGASYLAPVACSNFFSLGEAPRRAFFFARR
jgi:hypothetical protein